MYINGSLLQAMQEEIASAAVLVIDEYDGSYEGAHYIIPFKLQRTSYEVTLHQKKVIMLAQVYNCPIFLIQSNLRYPEGKYASYTALGDHRCNTKRSITALLPLNTIMINKHNLNAFHGNTTLRETLAKAGNGSPITTLVVMGTETNICIDATIGPENINRKFTPSAEGAGAIDHGFTVLTCQDVLTGRDEIWANKSPNIKFYSNI